MAPDKSLAAEIEAVTCSLTCAEQYLIEADFGAAAAAVREASRLLEAQASEIAALQSRAEDGAPKHVVEALRREARQQAFMRELADQTYRGMRERFLRAARRALDGGDDRALHRFVHTLESAVPIQGSAALQPEGERNV